MKILVMSCAVQDGSLERRKQAICGILEYLERLSNDEIEKLFVFEIDDKYPAFMVDVTGCESSNPASMVGKNVVL